MALPVTSFVILGTAFVVAQAVEAPSPPGCAATAMVAEATANVPVREDTRSLRARLSYARNEANAAEQTNDPKERWTHCHEALLAFADLAPDAFGRERGASAAVRARQLAAELVPPPPEPVPPPEVPPPRVKPELTPEQQWKRRRSRLIGHTTASAFFTMTGILLASVPWIVMRSCPEPDFCGPGVIGGIIMSGIGGPIAVISAIPLGIWSYRLQEHLQSGPPRLSILRDRARVHFTGPGLRLDF